MTQDSGAPPGVGHEWRPIEDLPHDWQSLADAELRQLARYWHENREELISHGAIGEFNERLKREWAIETGLIERVYTLRQGITEVLIEHGLREEFIPSSATDRDPGLVFDMIQDHAAAVDGLFGFVKRERQLSTSYVKELHAVLLAHQETASARNTFGRRVEMPLVKGDYKKRPNNPVRPDGLVHGYCPPEQVASEMDRLLAMHRVMIRAGWFPLVVTDAGRADYIGALEVADRGDLRPLVELFAGIQRRVFEGAIEAAEPTNPDPGLC